MQFYLSRGVTEEELRSVIAAITGLEVKLLSDPDVRDVTMRLDRIEGAFPLDLLLVFRSGGDVAGDRLGVARGLAKALDAQVATDLPESHPSAGDPYCWCVAEPTGHLVQMDEDMTAIDDREGLILDPRTRRPLPAC